MKILNLSSDALGRVPADPLLAAEGVVVAVGVLGRRPELKKTRGLQIWETSRPQFCRHISQKSVV